MKMYYDNRNLPTIEKDLSTLVTFNKYNYTESYLFLNLIVYDSVSMILKNIYMYVYTKYINI